MEPREQSRCEECNAGWREALETLFEQRPLSESLEALCEQCGCTQASRQVAFFLQNGELWSPAAQGPLTPKSQAALSAIQPQALFRSALERCAEAGLSGGFAFERGWARSLESGAGEVLGLIVSLSDGPMAPAGEHARRIGLACHAAALAIEQQNLMDELAFQAGHDALTGLLNRAAFERALGEAMRRHGAASFLCINLDRFRLVNEVLGHRAGDRVLEQAGRRFQECLRAGDLLARMGGDEFGVLLPGVREPKAAEAAAARLLRSLAAPFSVDGNELYVSASAGVVCSRGGSTVEALEREAFIALYHAKRAGKGRAMHFVASMATTPPERLEMEKHLRSALDRDEMLLYYQPQIELGTGRIAGAEALLRWRPAGLGIVSPAAFIPILEETGLIVEVGRWVLLEACRQAREWLRETGRALRIAVNVSAVQFQQADLVQQVESALADTGLPPALLELELTESLFVGDFDAGARNFRSLQQMGVSLALDDFGTGQSALSYLQNLPFERIKIDQSFIRRIAETEDCPPLVSNIIRMGAGLGMTTIAEGVETSHQEALLREAGCIEGQGYLYEKPLPAAAFGKFCRGWDSRGGVERRERTAPVNSA